MRQLVKFEIIAICPIHPNSIVTHIIEAPTHEIALGKVVGETVFCDVPPGHRFTVHAENVVGWQPLTPTYMPPREDTTIKEPYRPAVYVPPPPSEKIYYVGPVTRDRILRVDWWR